MFADVRERRGLPPDEAAWLDLLQLHTSTGRGRTRPPPRCWTWANAGCSRTPSQAPRRACYPTSSGDRSARGRIFGDLWRKAPPTKSAPGDGRLGAGSGLDCRSRSRQVRCAPARLGLKHPSERQNRPHGEQNRSALHPLKRAVAGMACASLLPALGIALRYLGRGFS